ncbi:MAG TPA: hypothetical protein VH989_04690 [Actinomycetota bacterium]|jgi:hypothetical protein
MDRRRVITLALMSPALLALGALGWLTLRTSDDPFAGLHQAAGEPIPGALGYSLGPVTEFRPSIDPSDAYAGLPGAGSGRDVSVTLATVDDGNGGTYGPAWVYFTHDLCYFEAKGDFVSVSRAGVRDGCTPNNFLVQMVDAASGTLLGAFSGYDTSARWLPQRVGNPAQTLGTTRFH